MSVALRGNLEDFGIAEVFQLIAQQRKTGVLEISGKGGRMRLAFDGGAVVWAAPLGESEHAVLGDMLVRCGFLPPERMGELLREIDTSARSLLALVVVAETTVTERDLGELVDLITQETIFQVLRWPTGSFDFSAQTVRHDRAPETLLSADQILMDGLRKVDEWQTFVEQVPAEELVFSRSGQFEVYRHSVSGTARNRLGDTERVFQLVDGRLSVRRIIDLSRLGTFDATRALAELREAGLVEPTQLARGRRRTDSGVRQPVAKHVRGWLAAAFPLALLMLVVSQAYRALPGPERSAAFPIVRAPLEQARLAFEKRRVRNAIEAARYLWGEWPERLDEADPTGLLDGATLTPDRSHPYYYARRGDEVIVLAPEY